MQTAKIVPKHSHADALFDPEPAFVVDDHRVPVGTERIAPKRVVKFQIKVPAVSIQLSLTIEKALETIKSRFVARHRVQRD